MRHLTTSFKTHKGVRGAHFFDEDSCQFLIWSEVIEFLNTLTTSDKNIPHEFADRLIEKLANYNPDMEYLAVQQRGSRVIVELYSEKG